MELEEILKFLGSAIAVITPVACFLWWIIRGKIRIVEERLANEGKRLDTALENSDTQTVQRIEKEAGICKGRSELLEQKVLNLQEHDVQYYEEQKKMLDKVASLAEKFVQDTTFDREIKNLNNRVDGKKDK